ncbi:MAG TPA: c-type cytochrome [Bacteroidota bacterium]
MPNWRRAIGAGLCSGALLLGQSLAPHFAGAQTRQPAADASLGKSIYESKCVECHGKEGKGNGPAAAFLNPRPRDFTEGKFKFRSTGSGSIPTDDDLLNTVRNGLHATAMPDWKPFIGDDSLKAVVEYVKSFSIRFSREIPKPVNIGAAVLSSPVSIAAGKKVYETLQCGSCHGVDGMGKDAVTTEFQDDWGYEIRATNLTEPWTFRGGSTPRDIYLRFDTGIDGSPMPSFAGSATEHEMWDLANYVVSLARKPVWTMNEREVIEFYSGLESGAKLNPVARGKYMVATVGCAFCHSPLREDGSIIEELKFAGGQRWDLYPFDNVVSYNLTSDKETGLGNWTDDQIKTFLTKGIRRNGKRMIPYPMPWPAFASMKAEDLNAIVAYLRTIPPVYNRIPDPQSPNIFSYLWGKFEVLVLKKDIPLHAFPGNAGTPKEKTISAIDARMEKPTGEGRQ